jgi:hypothetical protein
LSTGLLRRRTNISAVTRIKPTLAKKTTVTLVVYNIKRLSSSGDIAHTAWAQETAKYTISTSKLTKKQSKKRSLQQRARQTPTCHKRQEQHGTIANREGVLLHSMAFANQTNAIPLTCLRWYILIKYSHFCDADLQ